MGGEANSNFCGIILAAGHGSRLQSLKLPCPKVLLDIQDKPILFWIAERILRAVPRVIVVTNPAVHGIIQSVYIDSRVTVVSREPQGTGAELLWGLGRTDAKQILVCNADTVVDMPLGDIIRQHLESKHEATIVLTRRPDAQNAEAFAVNDRGLVIRSYEDGRPGSPPHPEATWHAASTGVMVCSNYALKRESYSASLERDLIPGLISTQALYAFDNGFRYCLDIGTPERLQHLYCDLEPVLSALKTNG